MIASAIGSSITVVAVLLTHIEMNAVTAMKPRISSAGRVPTIARVARASRLWRPVCSSARAIRKPPRKRKITGLAYGAAVASSLATPRTGKSTIGRRAVTAIGSGSVTHQVPIRIPTAATCQPATDSPSGGPARSSSAKSSGPRIRPRRGRRPELDSMRAIASPLSGSCHPERSEGAEFVRQAPPPRCARGDSRRATSGIGTPASGRTRRRSARARGR